jgi:hypothetical protein
VEDKTEKKTKKSLTFFFFPFFFLFPWQRRGLCRWRLKEKGREGRASALKERFPRHSQTTKKSSNRKKEKRKNLFFFLDLFHSHRLSSLSLSLSLSLS